MTIPPLRPLDAFPYEEENGRKLIGLRDPLGVVDGVLGVSPEAFFIASQFDGEHDAAQLCDRLSQQFGARVTPELVERVRVIFSERALLQDEKFSKIYVNAREEFARSASRAAAHAGGNYPDEPEAFRLRLSNILDEAEGAQPAVREVTGLIAPHIDLERGHLTYSHAYAALKNIGHVDRFIILGTSHGPTSGLLAPTRKDYETPIGAARTDREAIDRVAVALGDDAYDDEYAHKNEHSIEFQAIFIKLLFPDAQIVPLLCGSLRSFCSDDEDPAGNPQVEAAVAAIRAAIDPARRTVIIAGADLAHVGPRFGGPPISPELLNSTETGDLASLEIAASGDAHRWYRSVANGGDPRNTCGLSPIYFMLRALDGAHGRLLRYRRCESADQCVTIGAMVFSNTNAPGV
ncbi:MAG: AmmeMemoRadiSam system protein B [Planctomycetes bacterium]|nr:AmmeMemoRadiSam system protein B [Planctomycetota bacterium]